MREAVDVLVGVPVGLAVLVEVAVPVTVAVGVVVVVDEGVMEGVYCRGAALSQGPSPPRRKLLPWVV